MSRKELKVAVRYARALCRASAAEQLDAREQALLALTALWRESAELRGVLLNPAVSVNERVLTLRDISARVRPGDIGFENFTAMLVINGRLSALPEITAEFSNLIKRQRGIIPVEISSAFPLPVQEQEELQRDLEHELQQRVAVSWSVQPDLIGGLVIRAGDKLLDGSVGGMLARVHQQLLR